MRVDGLVDSRWPGLSDYWRVDRSADRSRELASILSGVASQAELVQRRLANAEHCTRFEAVPPILLAPRLLSGFGAPVPSVVVDCLVGLAVREAALQILSIESSRVAIWEQLSEEDRHEFTNVHRALEEVYIWMRLAKLSKTLTEYLQVMRDTLGMSSSRVQTCDQINKPTREEVMARWMALHLGGRPGDDLSDIKEQDAVIEMERKARPYLANSKAIKRLNLAADIWRWLKQFPVEPERDRLVWPWKTIIEDRECGDKESFQIWTNLAGGREPGRLIDLGQHLKEDKPPFSEAGQENARPEDAGVRVVTEELHDAGVRAAMTSIKDATFDLEDYDRVRLEVAAEVESMRRVFSRLDDVQSRWRYGLKTGRIDGRGLTRVAAGKDNVFKVHERQRGSSLALVFLVDVSASMRSYMPVVNRAACVVSEALRELAPRVWYQVITYTSGGLAPGAPVQLTRLAESGMQLSLRDVWTDGGTPTGEALATAALILRSRHAGRKLVLHFTDGHPKDIYVVRQALELCRRMNVDVLSVSVGSSQEALYGAGRCEVAYSVTDLTAVLARLLPRLYKQGR